MNNDLIRREDVFQELDSFLAEVEEKMLSILEQYGACANRAVTNCEETTRGAVNNIRERINAIPAVQQMSAVEYLAAEQRMCFGENVGKRNCSTCPLSSRINPARINCGDYTRQHPEFAVAIVQKWAQEHPEEVNDED